MLALTVAVVALGWTVADRAALYVFAFALVVAWALAASYLVKLASRHAPVRLQWSSRQLLVAVTCIAVIVSVLTRQWPFRLRFALSRSALEQATRRPELFGMNVSAQRAGLFTIRQAEVRTSGGQQYVCLWTDLGAMGYSGFVHLACNQTRDDFNLCDFNLWSELSLDDEWQFVVED
jgi:hypothetical protein